MRKRDYIEDAKKALIKTRLLERFSHIHHSLNKTKNNEEGQKLLKDEIRKVLGRMYDEGIRG